MAREYVEYSLEQAEKLNRIAVLASRLEETNNQQDQAVFEGKKEEADLLKTRAMEIIGELKSLDPEMTAEGYTIDDVTTFLVNKYNIRLHEKRH